MKHLLVHAQPIAESFLERHINPYCHRAVIGGSIRRKRSTVGDIEIVCIPQYETHQDLLGGVASQTNLLWHHLNHLMGEGHIEHAPHVCWPSEGKMRKFVLTTKNGVKYKFDIFTAEQGNWGNILAIRTGPAAYSRKMVTKQSARGWMPDHLYQKDGWLWNGDEQIECKTEEEFFQNIGLTYLPPHERKENV